LILLVKFGPSKSFEPWRGLKHQIEFLSRLQLHPYRQCALCGVQDRTVLHLWCAQMASVSDIVEDSSFPRDHRQR
jgi:hypothetical protein